MFFVKYLALFISAGYAIPTQENGPFKALPVVQRARPVKRSSEVDVLSWFDVLNKALLKYHHPTLDILGLTLPGLPKTKRAPTNVRSSMVGEDEAPRNHALASRRGQTGFSPDALVDVVSQSQDIEYYGNLEIPDQGQTFTVDFDTGSSDLFLPGPSCPSNECTGTAKYDDLGQSTMNTTTVTYGSGMIQGNNYLDTVTVAGLSAANQGLVSLTSSAGFSTTPPDGLVGMGFPSIANSGFTPFFVTLINQGAVKAKEFAFYLGRSQSNTQGNSEIALGGRDTSKFTAAVTNVPVTKQGYWQVALDSVTVNGASAGPTTKGQAAIDTGTTIILAPTLAAAAIFAKIPGAYTIPLASGSLTTTMFAYPCNTAAKNIPSITFAGKSFAINPLDFSFGQLTSDFLEQISSAATSETLSVLQALQKLSWQQYCVAAIAGADINPQDNLYVVGDTFLKSWYSIYSFVDGNGGPNPFVGFAKAVGN